MRGEVYLRASALHYLGDDTEIVASKDGGHITPDVADRKGTGSEFVLGGNVEFRRSTKVFFEASETTGVETKRSWNVQVGFRHSW